MLAKVISCAVVGLEGAIVEVEVDISPGLPSFTMVATEYLHRKQAGHPLFQPAPRLSRL